MFGSLEFRSKIVLAVLEGGESDAEGAGGGEPLFFRLAAEERKELSIDLARGGHIVLEMLGAVKGQCLIDKVEEIKPEGVRLKVLLHDKVGGDVPHQLDAQGGIHAVLFIADETADPTDDLVAGIDARNVHLLGDEAEMSEGQTLYVDGEFSLVVIDDDQIRTADTRLGKAGTFKRAAITVNGIAELYEVARGMAGAEGIIIGAELFQIALGDGTAGRIDRPVKVGIATDEIDAGGVVHVLFVKRALGECLFAKRPAVHRDVVFFKIEALQFFFRKNVNVGRQTSRGINRVVVIIVALSRSDDEDGVGAVAELADQNLRRRIGREAHIEKVAANQDDVYPAVTHVLHRAHKRIPQSAATLVALLRRQPRKRGVEMNIAAMQKAKVGIFSHFAHGFSLSLA